MKTRLLKKVRKRFQIFKVLKVEERNNSIYREYAEVLGVPFYLVQDEEQFLFPEPFSSLTEAYDYLLKKIIREYSHYSKKKNKVKYEAVKIMKI